LRLAALFAFGGFFKMASKIPVNILLNPLDHPVTPSEQKLISPFVLFPGVCMIGLLPPIVSAALGMPGQKFYFQRDWGKICLTRYNRGPVTQTPALVASKSRFAQAVAAWQALSPEEKAAWNSDQRRHDFRLPGYQFFLREYLRGKI